MKKTLHKLIDRFIIPNFSIETYDIKDYNKNLRHDVEIAIDVDYYTLDNPDFKTRERLYNETKMLMQMIGLTMVRHVSVINHPPNLIKVRGRSLK